MISPTARKSHSSSILEVLLTFLWLGMTSFGGPIAHIGYYRREFVERRQWIDDARFAQLLAICQFLPGPASSQMGFSLGLLRAGWGGAMAAFLAFTLPSALLLFAFAAFLPYLSGEVGNAALHGLKLVALAVVAQGVLGMARQLCPDASRRIIAISVASIVLFVGTVWVQLFVVAIGALVGLACCRNVPPLQGGSFSLHYGPKFGGMLLGLFAVLLVGLPLACSSDGLIAVLEAFYRAGALVFGGGHVVLPLLRDVVVERGWISPDEFLAGYGAAQAVPGPMFSLAAFLGARLPDEAGGVLGAVAALVAKFLPGFLLVAGILPLWQTITRHPLAAHAVAGVNAAVVGILGAALYDPVWTSAVGGPLDLAIALAGFALLAYWRTSALIVVNWCVAANITVVLLR